MHRTQVFIRNDQKEALSRLAQLTGRKQSDCIREGIDLYIQHSKKTQAWKTNLMQLAGCLSDDEGADMLHVAQQSRAGWNNRIQEF